MSESHSGVIADRTSTLGELSGGRANSLGSIAEHHRQEFLVEWALPGGTPSQIDRPLVSRPGQERDYRLISRAIRFLAGIVFAFGGCAIIALLLHVMLLAPIQALSAHLSP
jgi:hypothetical protein